MRKRFNVTGSCNPEWHYMVDTEKRFKAVEGLNSTFHSVILAGVYDVKNLKLKLRPDAEKKYNSPWNFATDFNVDMTFHPEEIAQMLGDYENDRHTGMDIKAISEEIYRYTNGYPFLVSYICKLIDEQFSGQWDADGILRAVKYIVQGGSTLMDDLSKNLEHYPDFREFMFQVVFNSEDYAYTLLNPMVNMGNMFSYIQNRNGREEFVVELKIWRGDKYEQKGRDQLSEYLATRGKDEGYLVTFDFSKNKEEKEPEWIECNGKRIFEAVI